MKEKVYLTSGQVKARYSVSDMTLWRWLHSDTLGFPSPIYINRYRYWKLAELEAWDEVRKLVGPDERATPPRRKPKQEASHASTP